MIGRCSSVGRRDRRHRCRTAAPTAGERCDLGDQFPAQLVRRVRQTRAVARLGYVIGGARGQRIERGGCATLGEGAAHDHRQLRIQLADLNQSLDPIQPGHLNVERDDVGIQLRNPGQGDRTVGSGPGDFDFRSGSESVAQ